LIPPVFAQFLSKPSEPINKLQRPQMEIKDLIQTQLKPLKASSALNFFAQRRNLSDLLIRLHQYLSSLLTMIHL
jgi:hypothetical protein